MKEVLTIVVFSLGGLGVLAGVITLIEISRAEKQLAEVQGELKNEIEYLSDWIGEENE